LFPGTEPAATFRRKHKKMTSRIGEYEVFWGEISPCDHLVQIYDEDAALLDALEGFIGGGLQKGDSAIVIATPTHLQGLSRRLHTQGLDVDAASFEDRYIALDAASTLSQFMRNGWPDEQLFGECVSGILRRARAHGRPVRAFGEMVALLWAQGHNGATVRLEYLWNNLCHSEAFTLLCAYPKTGFTQDASDSLRDICEAHSKIVVGRPN
jgi:hypothetical protein